MNGMFENLRVLLLATFLGIGATTIAGCDEGPFEEAGEEVDDAVDDVEDEL